jgi:ribonuclease P protein component
MGLLYYMAKIFSYGKEEKLKSRKVMQELFSKGKTFMVYPVKVFYIPAVKLDHLVKVGVGTSTRYFKKAVDRNHIKRLLRETYRIEKLSLHEYLKSSNKQAVIFFLYVDKSMPEYSELKTKMHLALNKLIKQLNETSTENT